MAQYSDEVKALAETLKNSGLAASMIDALDRAQSIIGVKGPKPETKKAVKEEPAEVEIDPSQTTLSKANNPEENDAEPSESIEIEEGLNEEEVFTEKTEQKQESNRNNSPNSQQKKIDLTEIFNVNK